MNPTTLVMVLLLCALLALPVLGLLRKERSIPLGVLSICLGALATLGAFYAVVESHSMAFGAGYGAIALLCFASAIRQFLKEKK